MIPCILKGDSSGAITITLSDRHTYDGATLLVVFNGVTHEFTDLAAGGTVTLAFTAAETAKMPLGTAMVHMRLIGPTGAVETVSNATTRIKVTDCIEEINAGGSFSVTPGSNPLDGVEGLGTRYTAGQLRAKINEVISKLGGTVSALLLCALPCLGGALDVRTAPFGTVYNDTPVVTNVILDVHALTNGWKFSEPIDLKAATNYANSALSDFSATGTVANAVNAASARNADEALKATWAARISDGGSVGADNYNYSGIRDGFQAGTNYTDTVAQLFENGTRQVGSASYASFADGANNLTSEDGIYRPADFFRAATNAAEAVVREKSLGGIWDQELGVWWTPIMENGALRYIATTNVNLNAENQ